MSNYRHTANHDSSTCRGCRHLMLSGKSQGEAIKHSMKFPHLHDYATTHKKPFRDAAVTGNPRDFANEEVVVETLSNSATVADWIHDFVHSTNPKFKGKSRKERIHMALGAYYGKQNEERKLDEARIRRKSTRTGSSYKHDKDYFTCSACDKIAAHHEKRGLTTSDAQGVAQAEHMKYHENKSKSEK